MILTFVATPLYQVNGFVLRYSTSITISRMMCSDINTIAAQGVTTVYSIASVSHTERKSHFSFYVEIYITRKWHFMEYIALRMNPKQKQAWTNDIIP
jgi:hypothetical protein